MFTQTWSRRKSASPRCSSLWENKTDAPATYIKREGDLLTLTNDIPTSIESAAVSTVSVSREGSQIVVTGEGIKSVSLYNVSGELITTSPSHHLTISPSQHLTISTPQSLNTSKPQHLTISTSHLAPGVYILRIEAGKQTHVYKFIL